MKRRIALLVTALVVLLVLVTGAAAHTTSPASIDNVIRASFGAAHDATAVCISHAEDPRRSLAAVSGTNDHGLFQIHVDYGTSGRWVGEGRWRTYFSTATLHTLRGNIRAALILSNHGHQWRAWTGTYGRGLCHFLS